MHRLKARHRKCVPRAFHKTATVLRTPTPRRRMRRGVRDHRCSSPAARHIPRRRKAWSCYRWRATPPALPRPDANRKDPPRPRKAGRWRRRSAAGWVTRGEVSASRDSPWVACLPLPPSCFSSSAEPHGAAEIYRTDANPAPEYGLRQLRRWHARENDGYLARQPFRVRRAVVVTRIGRHRRQPRRLLGAQIAGAYAEVMARGRLAAKNPVAPLDDIEV